MNFICLSCHLSVYIFICSITFVLHYFQISLTLFFLLLLYHIFIGSQQYMKLSPRTLTRSGIILTLRGSESDRRGGWRPPAPPSTTSKYWPL